MIHFLIQASNPPGFVRMRAEARRGGVTGALLTFVVIIGVLGAIGYSFYYDRGDNIDTGELITKPVTRGAFDHIVLEQGEIESSSNIEVICEVKSKTGGTPILWVIDEGTKVRKGDKLVELDRTQLEETLRTNQINVNTAEANVTTAEALVQQAIIARQEYLEGTFKTEEQAIVSEIAVKEQELRKMEYALKSSQRLVAKGLIRSLQLEADQFAVANARNERDAAKGRLRVLRELTRKKKLVEFDSNIESEQAKLSAFESELITKKAELAETEEQIKKCIITAPADGVVVHANKFSSRGGSEFVVEAGVSVRERQELIYLPDPAKMQVKCKINESRITLVRDGMAVKIAVDAVPGLTLKGIVSKVNRYAEPGSWFSSNIKEYAVFVDILDPPETIRTGMTAEVQVFVEQLEDATQIPIEGLYEHGGKMYALVQNSETEFRTAEVEIGATNDTMATIKSGVEEGETVILNLRDHLSLMTLPDVTVTDNSEMREIAEDAAKSGKYNRGPQQGGKAGANGPPSGGERRGGGGSGGGGRAGGGPGGRGQGGGAPGGGGQNGGGFGGGRPDAAQIASFTMQRYDKNSDGVLSSDEIQAIDAQFRDGTLE
ncbi:MAG: HlyD family efflux transporter periplasmic adaptor subunit, partial [Planctomycetota bacterium]